MKLEQCSYLDFLLLLGNKLTENVLPSLKQAPVSNKRPV